MKKTILKSYSFLVLLITVAIITFSVTFSWLNQIYSIPDDILGKTKSSYFGGGDGNSAPTAFTISKAEHFFNLSYLQNMGIFNDKVYYFRVANDIDFSNAAVLGVHRSIQPIGTAQYPFKGVFDGNSRVLKSYSVDGTGKQDIGTFGYVGAGSSVTNLFLESPEIISNPTVSSINPADPYFHTHNSGLKNIATGYIVGHIGTGALVENVFVVSPTIQSLSNAYSTNRSQYGLIGYNESNQGVIPGGPKKYSFTLNSVAAAQAIRGFMSKTVGGVTNGQKYKVAGTTLTLSQVIIVDLPGKNPSIRITNGYTLSTIRIYTTDPNQSVYLYDQMVAEGFPIKYTDANNIEYTYSRENIDIIGEIDFSSDTEIILGGHTQYTIPSIGSQFNPANYPETVIMYVRPTNDKNNLGNVKVVYINFNQGKSVFYNLGWINGVYQGGSLSGTDVFNAAGTEGATMTTGNAFTAVQVNRTTGAMMVVDTLDTIPDYYVYVLSLSNGNQSISNMHFEYNPAAITPNELTAISKVDFINSAEIASLRASSTNYDFSYVNFSYEMADDQRLGIATSKLLDAQSNYYYEINFSYAFSPTAPDLSVFYVNIINCKNKTIKVKNGTAEKTLTDVIIEVRIEKTGTQTQVLINGVLLTVT